MRNISTAIRGHYDDDGYMWTIIIRRFCDTVRVRTTFNLLDVARGPAPSLTISCGVWTFSRIGQSCCHARFMERKKFESSYVKDDEFCIIKVQRDSPVGRCAAAIGPVPAIR
jgi:hypothetical protein